MKYIFKKVCTHSNNNNNNNQKKSSTGKGTNIEEREPNTQKLMAESRNYFIFC